MPSPAPHIIRPPNDQIPQPLEGFLHPEQTGKPSHASTINPERIATDKPCLKWENCHDGQQAMSRAKNQFDESIKDAETLLAHFNAARSAPGGLPPANAEVLKRAGLILAVTAWETYIEDRAREALEASLAAMTGSPVAQFMRNRFGDDMKRFHNPNSDKTAKLFKDYFGKDVTTAWTCNPGGASQARRNLDKWVQRRGEAAHRSPIAGTGKPSAPHLITCEELQKLINFLKALVIDTEATPL